MRARCADQHVMIDTGLRLPVGRDRFAVVRCSSAFGSSSLVDERSLIAGDFMCTDSGCSCDPSHKVISLPDAAVALDLDDDGIALGFSEIVGTMLTSYRSQFDSPRPSETSL